MKLKNKKIINLVHHDYEDSELWFPVYFLRGEGASVFLAGEMEKFTYFGKYGAPAVSDLAYSDVDPDEYDGLLIPGGWAPDKLRRFPEVLQLVRTMHENKKPIGHICHGGWVLISSGIISGRNVTSTPGIKDDIENAGGIWSDEAVVVDGNIVSGRRPADLPQYAQAYIDLLTRKRKRRTTQNVIQS